MASLTQLIQRVGQGDREARDELFAVAYPELRKLARARLSNGDRSDGLETTALVHESYMRYLRSGELRATDRRAFFAFASQVMRSVIIDTVRESQARRRGGDLEQVTLGALASESPPSQEQNILDVHEALLALEAVEPGLAKVVEMRYFGGYTDAEIAEVLDLTERIVRRHWTKARLLLLDLMRG